MAPFDPKLRRLQPRLGAPKALIDITYWTARSATTPKLDKRKLHTTLKTAKFKRGGRPGVLADLPVQYVSRHLAWLSNLFNLSG